MFQTITRFLFITTFLLLICSTLIPSFTYASRTRLSSLTGKLIALPTPQQIDWQAEEVSVIIHFNIATYIANQSVDSCGSVKYVPDINLYNPKYLNMQNWVDSILDLGAKGAVLVTKHGCGFANWPTNVTFTTTDGTFMRYNYSIGYSPIAGTDIVTAFTNLARKNNIKVGLYLSLLDNNYLSLKSGNFYPPESGGVSVNMTTYNNIMFALLTEIWTTYGALDELWFDGSFSELQRKPLTALISQLQPSAIALNAYTPVNTTVPVSTNAARWIGNERGVAPDPTWSTGSTRNGGDPNSPVYCPAECPTTLQQMDRWFKRDIPLRNLSDLINVYHDTVGHNCRLLLDLAPDVTGLIPADHAALYKRFGDFIRTCYNWNIKGLNDPIPEYLNPITGESIFYLNFTVPTSIDRIVLRENQDQGQVIRRYKVDGSILSDDYTQLSIGSSIGNKKIDVLKVPVTITSIRVTITETADIPILRSISVHLCDYIEERAIERE